MTFVPASASAESGSTHRRSATWLADRRWLPFIGAVEPECRTVPGFSTSGIAGSSIAATSTPPRIDQTCRNHQAGRALGYRSVTSGDGTRLRAWDNDGHGVPVLISNGLGTPHDAWPDINRRTDTYRVMTWDHRGLGGSERPSDESRISISDHTDDLFAVMDSYGIDRAVSPGPAPCRATRTRTPSRWAATRPHPAARPEVSRQHAPAHQPAR